MSTPVSAPKRLAVYHIGLIILLSSLNYLNALSGPFLWDDRPLILENAFLRTPQPLYTAFTTDYWSFASARKTSGYYRPLLLLSYRLDTFFWGFRPFGFHLTNLLLHTLVAVLVYRLACHLLPSARNAWLAALFFAAHPIHTESVSWISGRTDLIVTLFLLAAFLSFLYLQRVQGRRRTLSLSLLLFCFALALLAKENALVFPLLLLGYRWLFPLQEERYTLGYAVGGSVALIALYLGLRFALVGSPVPAASSVQPFTTRLLTAPKLFLTYLRLLLFPVGLHIQRHVLLTPLRHLFAPEALFYLLLTLLVVLAAYALRRRFPQAVFAFYWIGVPLLPVLNLFPLRQAFAERFLYLPSVGFALLLAFLLFYPVERGWMKPAVSLGCALLILVGYTAGTIRRNDDWRDEERFWKQTIAKAPSSTSAHLALGIFYREHGAFPQAITELQEVIRLQPQHVAGYYHLARTYVAMGKVDEALAVFQTAITRQAQPLEFLYDKLGILYDRTGRYTDAIAAYQKALKINPRYAVSHYNLGVVYARLQRYEEAIVHYRQALSLRPYYQQAQHNLAVTYYQAGEYHERRGEKEKAIRYYEEFLRTWQGKERFKRMVMERMARLREGGSP